MVKASGPANPSIFKSKTANGKANGKVRDHFEQKPSKAEQVIPFDDSEIAGF
jgi:hypothetical protein